MMVKFHPVKLDPIEILYAYAMEGRKKRGHTPAMVEEIEQARSSATKRAQSSAEQEAALDQLYRTVPWGLFPEDDKDPNYGRVCACAAPLRRGMRTGHVCAPGALEARRKKMADDAADRFAGVRVGLRAAADTCERVLVGGPLRLVAAGFAKTLRDMADDSEVIAKLARAR